MKLRIKRKLTARKRLALSSDNSWIWRYKGSGKLKTRGRRTGSKSPEDKDDERDRDNKRALPKLFSMITARKQGKRESRNKQKVQVNC